MRKARFKGANKFYRLDSMPDASHPRRSQIGSYYETRRSRQLMIIKRWLIIITVIILGQSIFQLPILRISKIQIEGIRYIPQNQLEAEIEEVLERRRWLIFRNSNYLLFTSFDLATKLENEYHLAEVQLDKKFPNSLTLRAKEKLSPFIRQTPDGYYALDFRGQILGQLQQPEPGQIIVADERTDRNQGLPLDYLELATSLTDTWKQGLQSPTIVKFHLTDSIEDIIITTDAGYRVFFTRNEDLSVQMSRLQEILNQDAVPETIEYIDLRFENNIYYK